MDKFPSRMFRWAAIYGVAVLLPLYLAPLPKTGGEIFLGFVGLALVFQGVFWTIGGDPVKYRALMPYAVAEKLVFALPALTLWARGYPVDVPIVAASTIDLVLGIGFFLAWRVCPRSD